MFMLVRGVSLHLARFQIHAALGALTGFALYHLRVHGAGVFDGCAVLVARVFMLVRGVSLHLAGFQIHAALGTLSGLVLHDFRVHGASVLNG